MKLFKKFKLEDKTNKFNKTDWIIMGILVLVYGIISFIRLGDTKVPVTYKVFNDIDDYAIVTLEEETKINKMRYYVGNELGNIEILSSLDGIYYEEVSTLKIGGVFYWADQAINREVKYIKFVGKTGGVTLGDVVFYDDFMNKVNVVSLENDPLTDETDLVPDEISFMSSTYFDEIYYGRTAYEYAHGINVYEWSHPPLGKLLITIPVALFGFSPFNYRLVGNLFGIMLIPLMYILAKKIFKNRKWALLAGLIMMFDCFHFAHTRICLVDGIQVFFILLSVLFMKNYMDLGKKSPFKKKAIYLLLSGTFIGCAIDTKWNALYVGLGLAITFFVHLLKQYDVNVIKYLKEKFTVNKIIRYITIFIIIPFVSYYLSFIIISKGFANVLMIIYYSVIGLFLIVMFFAFIIRDKYLLKLFITCVISFILIPVIIYILSYVLFPTVSYYDGTLKGVYDVSKMMYEYHANLVATHPFSSVWYEWPIMARPVWLYSGINSKGLYMTITDIGNPAIWWTGILAVVYLVINFFKKKDDTSKFLLIFIISTFVPYVFVGRLMFMYHYFITLPFVMLGIVAFIKWINEKTKNNMIYYGYIALVIIVFMVFYPVISALPVSSDYVHSLQWLSGWYF